MPKNAKKHSPYKKREFELYTLWNMLPIHYRGLSLEIFEKHGHGDPLFKELEGIQTQTEFAKHFHIKDPGTLTDWNNQIDWKTSHNKYLGQFTMRYKQYTINVLEGIFRRAKGEKSGAADAKLWLQFVEGWNPRKPRQIEAVCPYCQKRCDAISKKELKKKGWYPIRKKRSKKVTESTPKESSQSEITP